MPRSWCKKCGKYLDPQKYESIKIGRSWTLDQALSGEEPPDCPEGQHEREIGDSWSYEWLHVLKNGDELTIFSPDNLTQVVWSGIISLCGHGVFKEHVFNHWVHSDQEGIDREIWATYFFKEYPAELTPIRKSP